MTTKWKNIRIKQELVTAVKNTLEIKGHRSLSEFVSEATQLRLAELRQIPKKTVEKRTKHPMIHERLLYTSRHMWATVTPEGSVTVGLSEYAQRHLKGVASIHVDRVGFKVKGGEPFGVVETWMFMFDLYSPISGTIVKVNKDLQDDPSIIHDDPYEIAWIAEIEPANMITLEEELRGLMRPHQYKTRTLRLSRSQILGF